MIFLLRYETGFGIFLGLPEGAAYTLQMLGVVIPAKQMEENLGLLRGPRTRAPCRPFQEPRVFNLRSPLATCVTVLPL